MAEMRIVHHELDAAGQGVQETAAKMHGDLGAFQAKLASHGEPWGKELNDPIGPLIGLCYGAIASAAMACYAANAKELSRQGDKARASATTYRGGEEGGIAGINRVREVLG
jgi:hypothetical protein